MEAGESPKPEGQHVEQGDIKLPESVDQAHADARDQQLGVDVALNEVREEEAIDEVREKLDDALDDGDSKDKKEHKGRLMSVDYDYDRYQTEAITNRSHPVETIELSDSQREALLGYVSPKIEWAQGIIDDNPELAQKAQGLKERGRLQRIRDAVKDALVDPNRNERGMVKVQDLLEGFQAMRGDIDQGRVDVFRRAVLEDYLKACRDYQMYDSPKAGEAMADATELMEGTLKMEVPSNENVLKTLQKRHPLLKPSGFAGLKAGPFELLPSVNNSPSARRTHYRETAHMETLRRSGQTGPTSNQENPPQTSQ